MAIFFRHLLPGFTSYLIVNITISIPGMILGETTLSFLGLGINPPDVSWGSLLQQAQDVTAIGHYPWLLFPCVAIILAVVFFNFIGDGLRDAADPLHRINYGWMDVDMPQQIARSFFAFTIIIFLLAGCCTMTLQPAAPFSLSSYEQPTGLSTTSRQFRAGWAIQMAWCASTTCITYSVGPRCLKRPGALDSLPDR
jgi:hypothetical protein